MDYKTNFNESVIHELEQYMWDNGINLPKSQKTLFIAGILLALKIDPELINDYKPDKSGKPDKPDFIIANKFVYNFYRPARGDIVVFHPPEAAHSEGKDYIKRIVAVGGDTVEIRDGVLFLNGLMKEENYTLEPIGYSLEKITVPENSYFVLGDNRNNSADSHVWGFLPKQNIIGKAVLVIFPFNRIKTM